MSEVRMVLVKQFNKIKRKKEKSELIPKFT